jgi:hypothetical protein
MDESILQDLSLEEQSPFQKQMLSDSRALKMMSWRKMCSYYTKWDKNYEIWRSLRARQIEDVKAKERDEPERMVVPISFSQVSTFQAFCQSLFTQRETIFELEGYTAEDEKSAKVGEALLAHNLRYNKFEALLNLFLLDVARFGLGVLKIMWHTEMQTVREQQTIPGLAMVGLQLTKDRQITVERETVKYQGNKIIHISPYRFFPDTRLPLVRFQEGEFCASEEYYSHAQLKQWEHEGLCTGVDYIKPMNKEYDEIRGYRFDTGEDSLGALAPGGGMRGDGQIKKTILLSEIHRNLIPAKYEVDGKPIGPEDFPQKWVIWLANNQRVIKCEPLGYLHNQFPYVVAPFIYDDNIVLSDSLMDTIGMLQDTISFFINSRITNVRKVIQDKLIVQPKNINMDDLDQRRPVIKLTSAATGDIDRSIKQLQLQDVTTNHVADVKVLKELTQEATGINDTLMGQFQGGRRSATEHRNTTTGAASRVKSVASVIYWTALEPMAQQMLSNLRDGLDEAQFVKIIGLRDAVEGGAFIQVTKDDLIGNYQIKVFDGTLPSERSNTAQALEEVLALLLNNPAAAAIFGLDPRKILREVMLLRGIKNPERFELDDATRANIATAVGPGTTPPRVSGGPEQSVLPEPSGNGSGGSDLAAFGGNAGRGV